MAMTAKLNFVAGPPATVSGIGAASRDAPPRVRTIAVREPTQTSENIRNIVFKRQPPKSRLQLSY